MYPFHYKCAFHFRAFALQRFATAMSFCAVTSRVPVDFNYKLRVAFPVGRYSWFHVKTWIYCFITKNCSDILQYLYIYFKSKTSPIGICHLPIPIHPKMVFWFWQVHWPPFPHLKPVAFPKSFSIPSFAVNSTTPPAWSLYQLWYHFIIRRQNCPVELLLAMYTCKNTNFPFWYCLHSRFLQTTLHNYICSYSAFKSSFRKSKSYVSFCKRW